MIKRLKLRFEYNFDVGLIHDSRKDVRKLAETLEKACYKIDELVDEVNRLTYESEEKR